MYSINRWHLVAREGNFNNSISVQQTDYDEHNEHKNYNNQLKYTHTHN